MNGIMLLGLTQLRAACSIGSLLRTNTSRMRWLPFARASTSGWRLRNLKRLVCFVISYMTVYVR